MTQRSRIIWRVLIGMATALILGIAALWLFVFHTAVGAATVVRLGLQEYDAVIQAQIRIDSVTGTLADGAVVHNIRFTTSKNAPIIDVHQLHVSIDPLALLSKQVHVANLLLRGVTLNYHPKSGLTDLSQLAAPTNDTVNTADSGGLPQLPVQLMLDHATMKECSIVQLHGDQRTPLFQLMTLDTSIDWKDQLKLQIHQFEGAFPTAAELGPIGFTGQIEMKAGSVDGQVEGHVDGLRWRGGYTQNPHRTAGNVAVNGKAGEALFALLKQPGTVETLRLSANCGGSKRISNCRASVNGTSLQVGATRVDQFSLNVDTPVSFSNVHASATAVGIHADGVSMDRLSLKAHKTDDKIHTWLSVMGTSGEDAAMTAVVHLGNTIDVEVQTLNSNLYHVRVAATKPFSVGVTPVPLSVRTSASLRVNDAPVVLKQFVLNDDTFQVEATAAQVELTPFSALMGASVTGLASATLKLAGTMSHPQLQLNANVENATINRQPLGRLNLSASYQDAALTASMHAATGATKWLDATATVPLALNLTNGKVTLLENKEGIVTWNTLTVNDRALAPFMRVEHLQFVLDSKGHVRFFDGAISITSDMDATISHPRIGTANLHATIDAQTDHQSVVVAATDKDGHPLTLNIQSDLSLSDVRRDRFPQGTAVIVAKIGDSRAEGTIQLVNPRRTGIYLKLKNVNTGLATAYLPAFKLKAMLNGDVGIWFNPRTRQLAPMTDTDWALSWELDNLTPARLAPYVETPPELDFNARFNGQLTHRDGELVSTGQFAGWTQLPGTGKLPTELNYTISETKQDIALDCSVPVLGPLTLDWHSAFSLWQLASGDVHTDALRATAQLGQATASLKGHMENQQNGELTLELNNVSPLMLPLNTRPTGLRGNLDGKAFIRLTNGTPQLNAAVSSPKIDVANSCFTDVFIRGQYKNNRLKIRLGGEHQHGETISVFAAVPLQIDMVRMTVNWNPNAPHTLQWKIPSMSLYPYRALLHIPDGYDLSVRAQGRILGNVNHMQAKVAADGRLQMPGWPEIPVSLRLDGNGQKQTAYLKMQAGTNSATMLSLVSKADIRAIAAGDTTPSDTPITGTFTTGRFDLALLGNLSLPGLSKPKGIAKGNLSFRGTVANPRISGRLRISNGKITVLGLANGIRNIQGDIHLYKDTLYIKKMTFQSGKGKGRIWGRTTMADGALRGWVKLNAVQFPVAYVGLPRFELNARAKSSFEMNDGRLTADVSLTKTGIQIPSDKRRGTALIPSNENVIMYVDKDVAAGTGLNYRISVHTSKPISVSGRDVDTFWNADLMARRDDGTTVITGTIDAVHGTVVMLQNVFTINQGQLTLSPIADKGAYLQLSATSRVADTDIFLDLNGNLLRPKLHLRSSPSLSEEQIISLLVSGSAEEDAETSTGALTTILALEYPGVHNLLYERFGISQLKIETTDSGSTSLKAGRRVTERSTIFTAVNPNPAKNENEIELQVETNITEKTSIGTSVGAKSSSLGVYRKVKIPNKEKDKAAIKESNTLVEESPSPDANVR